jgi:hypothetical protein
MDSTCSNHLCGTGKCFALNDPSLPYVCLCPNAQFAMSCQSPSNDILFFGLN